MPAGMTLEKKSNPWNAAASLPTMTLSQTQERGLELATPRKTPPMTAAMVSVRKGAVEVVVEGKKSRGSR
jgi:hypothetical protein